MKLLKNLLLAASVALVSTAPALALPVSDLRFATGSYCGLTASNSHWTSFKASKGQQLTIIVPASYDEMVITKITNNTTGKQLAFSGKYTEDGSAIISEMKLPNTGKYTIKLYDAETYEEIAGAIGICIE